MLHHAAQEGAGNNVSKSDIFGSTIYNVQFCSHAESYRYCSSLARQTLILLTSRYQLSRETGSNGDSHPSITSHGAMAKAKL
jgi:hypothetical protein